MNNYIDKTASLTPFVRRIMLGKGTEAPHSGQYNGLEASGTFLCRRCGLALFRANSQFSSGCGWPSFDTNIKDAVQELPDADGKRREILCQRCDGHLGHVFHGEHFTHNNTRHCVNAASLDFVEDSTVIDTEEAIVAGGCFWGVEHFLKLLPGVLQVYSGYIGGHIPEPRYNEVCEGNTGHYEAVRVLFDKNKIDYQSVIKRFFEIHDPSQGNGQGPDIGQQYQSAVFCYNDEQKAAVNQLIQQLKQRHYSVATKILEMAIFWQAEDYHQDYYAKHQKLPYCHRPEPRFG